MARSKDKCFLKLFVAYISYMYVCTVWSKIYFTFPIGINNIGELQNKLLTNVTSYYSKEFSSIPDVRSWNLDRAEEQRSKQQHALDHAGEIQEKYVYISLSAS